MRRQARIYAYPRVSPDADAEVPTSLFDVSLSTVRGFTVSPTRIIVSNEANSRMQFYDHDGTLNTSETLTLNELRLDYFNGDVLTARNRRYSLDGTLLETYIFGGGRTLVHTRLGILAGHELHVSPYQLLPYGKTAAADIVEIDSVGVASYGLAHQNDLLYSLANGSSGYYALSRITEDDTIELVTRLNIEEGAVGFSSLYDIAIYRDTLYSLQDDGTTGGVYTLDIRKYRPMGLNTKTRIDVQFIDEGRES